MRFAYKEAGRTCSEGRRLLNLVARDMKHLAMAAALDCSERHVGRLLAGEREPSHVLAARIQDAWGIDAVTWGLAPRDSLAW